MNDSRRAVPTKENKERRGTLSTRYKGRVYKRHTTHYMPMPGTDVTEWGLQKRYSMPRSIGYGPYQLTTTEA